MQRFNNDEIDSKSSWARQILDQQAKEPSINTGGRAVKPNIPREGHCPICDKDYKGKFSVHVRGVHHLWRVTFAEALGTWMEFVQTRLVAEYNAIEKIADWIEEHDRGTSEDP